MKKTRFISCILALVMLLSVFTTGCSPETTDVSGDKKGEVTDNNEGTKGEVKEELIIAQGADAKTLDPHATNDGASLNVMIQIYDTLVIQTKDGEIVPNLAKEWEVIDDLTWQFKLEEGVKFHNGEELKASDVKFTFERALASSTISHILSAIESVEVVDDYTFNLHLKYQFAPILAHLAYNASAILNEKAVTEAGEDYGQKPVGTGPYMLADWQAGDSIDLVANEEYFRGVAPTKKIKYRNIPETASRSIALETGEIDIAYDIDPVDKERISTHSGLTLIEEPSLMVAYLGFNMNKEPFDKVEVRKAISHAIDREGIISAVLMGAGEAAYSPLPPTVAMSNQDVYKYDYDLEKAKELLKKVGLEDGFSTSIWINDNPVRVRMAQIIQADLKKIGIEAEIEILEWGSYLDRTANGEHEMFMLGWTTVTADPDYGLYALFHSTQHGSAGNRSFYTNARVDELLDLGKVEIDSVKRQEDYYEAQELITEDSSIATIYYDTHNAGQNKKVSGFELSPTKNHRLYGVQSEK